MEEAETKRRRRGPCLPLEQRMRLYDEVLELRQQGLSYNQIVERIYWKHGIELPRTTVEYWARRLQSPLGRLNKFDGKASPELAYLIGALLSDGCRHSHSRHYGLWLGSKDYEYTHEFGRCLAKVLGREKYYAPRRKRSIRHWVVEGSSLLLSNALDMPWHKLKHYIEHCRACVTAFLRAFFDGEGCISGRALTVYNTNNEKLRYVKHLLQLYFGIEATGPHDSAKTGQPVRFPRDVRTHKRKKALRYLYVPVQHLSAFNRYIGFTITRKQQRLAEAVENQLSSYSFLV